jgi:lipopolysaccharide transport system permease protein
VFAMAIRQMLKRWPRFNISLIWQLTKRETLQRYRGSLLGMTWIILGPLLVLSVYAFVFSEIFPSRWASMPGSADFAVMIFCGMIFYGLFADCVSRASGLILGNPNYVKKVIFPLHVLPVVSVLAGVIQLAINMVVLEIFVAVFLQRVPVTLPLAIFPVFALAALCLGLSWLLASLGIFLRDIGQVTGFILSILFFLSPVLYPLEAVPEKYRSWMKLNPLTTIIENARRTLVTGEVPSIYDLAWPAILGMAVAGLGLFWFVKTKKGFADVM